MVAQFNFAPLRNTAISLVKKFGTKDTQPITLLRSVDPTPVDATKPWRVGSPTILQFPFIGVTSFIASTRGEPVYDQDIEVIAPGDLATVGALTNTATLCGDPTIVDRLLIDGTYYMILGVKPVTGGSLTLIYKMRAKAWPQITPQPSTPF